MRNALLSLLLLGAGLLAFGLMLPILGVLFIIVIVAIVAVVGLLLAAPFLARLPWFRDRIHVHRNGSGSSIRFGRSAYGPQSDRQGQRPMDHGDVIDVTGRELPPDDEKQG